MAHGNLLGLGSNHGSATVPPHLIGEALSLSTSAIAYHVSAQLAKRFPDKALLQTGDCAFAVEDYAQAGLCTLAAHPALHNEIETTFDGINHTLTKAAKNAWYTVTWQDQQLDVLLMTWTAGWTSSATHWILADTRELAEQFFLAVCEWNSEIRDEVLVFQDGFWSKNPDLFCSIKSATFDNLVLHGTLKHDLQADLVHFFNARTTYETYTVPWKRGILLIGPPGNGKTHAVKALINTLGYPCLYVKSFNSEHATDNGNIHRVFERARQSAPCLLVLEDLDSLINDKNRSFFLNELDGFAANTGIAILATTNHPDRLDPAIVDRPSRFDRKYHFALPGLAERQAYIQLWNTALQPALQLPQAAAATVAERTADFSFAYLKELFLSAMMSWINLPQPAAMESVILAQIDVLREQMISQAEQARSLHQPDA